MHSGKDVNAGNRIMRVFLTVSVIISVLSMTAMMLYASNKVVLITGEETETSVEEQSPEAVSTNWRVSLARGNDKIFIPVGSSEWSVDEDYANNTVNVIIKSAESAYFMSHAPEGTSMHVSEATASFDGENVRYEFKPDVLCETNTKIEGDGIVISFEEIEAKSELPVVVIDPGHGGNSMGNIAGNLTEKDVVLRIASYIKEMAKGHDYSVYLTRTADVYRGTDERLRTIETLEGDYYVGLHLKTNIEDTKVYGISGTYNGDFYRNGLENVTFADTLLTSIAMAAGNRALTLDRATDDDIILKVIDIPSAELYLGYISNPDEAELLSNDEYLKIIAGAIVDAIDETVR